MSTTNIQQEEKPTTQQPQQTLQTQPPKPSPYDPKGVARIKKAFLVQEKPEVVGEKRKLENGQETTTPKKKRRGQYKKRHEKNREQIQKQKQKEPPKQTGELNKVSTDLRRQLSRKKYEYKKTEEVYKHVNEWIQYKQKFNSNIINKLNRKKMDDYIPTKLKPNEIKKVDWKGKLYLAPLTTVGNLPFRRICVNFGADITCGEMALASNILKGQKGELSLFSRHESEKIFGVQVAGSKPEEMIKLAELIENEFKVDFVDINCGCPVKLMCDRGIGCALMTKQSKLEGIIRGMKEILSVPLTVKIRKGEYNDKPIAHKLIPLVQEWGADAVTLHGRSKQQRYTKAADWEYIAQCASVAQIPLIGNGDILSWEDYEACLQASKVSSIMIARGALIKPWLFKEIKERKLWDISSSERLEMLKEYVKMGLDHWGGDDYGVEMTRRFLLEWMSFLHRYIPAGVTLTVKDTANDFYSY